MMGLLVPSRTEAQTLRPPQPLLPAFIRRAIAALFRR